MRKAEAATLLGREGAEGPSGEQFPESLSLLLRTSLS